jgi:hypothetical protein
MHVKKLGKGLNQTWKLRHIILIIQVKFEKLMKRI